MNKHVNIEWPYDQITLHFDKQAIASEFDRQATPPMSREDWELLARCEKPLYEGEFGSHSFTAVNVNEGHRLVNEVWEHALQCAEAYTNEDISSDEVRREAARRTAAALAILAFGKDFLLK